MQLILDVKDKNKAALLLEFLKSLNYVKSVKQLDKEQDFVVPEWHKKIVMDRIKNSKPENYIEWKDFKKELKRKYDF